MKLDIHGHGIKELMNAIDQVRAERLLAWTFTAQGRYQPIAERGRSLVALERLLLRKQVGAWRLKIEYASKDPGG